MAETLKQNKSTFSKTYLDTSCGVITLERNPKTTGEKTQEFREIISAGETYTFVIGEYFDRKVVTNVEVNNQ